MTDTIKLKTINDIKIKPVKLNTANKTEIKGYDYFPEIYSNIFLLAKKKSGKTTLIYNIIKNTALKNYTKIIIICSTINRDATYEKIKEYCNKNFPDNEYYDDIINDDGNNIIEDFIKNQKLNANDTNHEIKPISDLKGGFIKFTPITNNKPIDNIDEIKEESNILIEAPKFIIIIDDLGIETRNKYITQLLKTNRHYKTKVILSSQNLEDLQPAAIRNLDYILLFNGIPEEKIYKIRDQILLDIDKTKLFDIYKIITNKKYNFLYIDIRNEILRANFNREII